MDYEEMLEEQGIEKLGYIKDAVEIALATPNGELKEDTILETCQPFKGDPTKTYLIMLDNDRCGQVNCRLLYMCDHHNRFVAEKRALYPIKVSDVEEVFIRGTQ